MATYHVCDICGENMPKEENRQCFVQVGAKKTFRRLNPDYDGLPHINIECCPRCAEKVSLAIQGMQARPMCGKELGGDE